MSGAATFNLALPNDQALANLPYFVQAFTPDATGPNGAATTSRAGRSVLGN